MLLGIYKLSAHDIEALDRFEGLGRSYDRILVTPEVNGMAMRCFTYVKRNSDPEPPTEKYFQRIVRGFKDWRFPDRRLYRALDRSKRDQLRDTLGRKQQASFYSRWEPTGTNAPNKNPQIITTSVDQIEWGKRKRDNKLCFRFPSSPYQWYLDISSKADEKSGLVRGLKLEIKTDVGEVPPSMVLDQSVDNPLHGMSDDGNTFTNSLGQTFRKKNGVWIREKSQEN